MSLLWWNLWQINFVIQVCRDKQNSYIVTTKFIVITQNSYSVFDPHTHQRRCIEQQNVDSKAYNEKLQALIAKFVYADIYSPLMEMIQNAFGGGSSDFDSISKLSIWFSCARF